MKISYLFKTLLLLCLVAFGTESFGQRHMEKLNRGVVATNAGDGTVFISWRVFGDDHKDVSFNLYRTSGSKTVKLNRRAITGASCFTDSTADLTVDNSYYVRPIHKGKEDTPSEIFTLPANYDKPYISIPLRTPERYSPNDCSVGDLDGDGEYEIIVHMVGVGRDNAHKGLTTDPIFQAYKLDGTFLWEINLGKNIREGAHYTQFMVYDFDGDGKAELICKTADGTIDGLGNVIGDPNADWRERLDAPSPSNSPKEMAETLEGRIISGPEYLTVFEGATGKALATVDYVPARGELMSWGDGRANRSERYLAGVAYLDGVHPSVIMCRGYYARTSLTAWDWRDGKLTQRWAFDTHDNPELRAYRGQGAHSLAVADVDDDGFDEIIYGACVIDHDGTGLYSTRLGHGDALHVSDLDPGRPGLEVFMVHEVPNEVAGTEFRDARTGQLIWGRPSKIDNGRGVSFDIDPRHEGNECWSAASPELLNAKGQTITYKKPNSTNFAIWWDGDLLRELLNGNKISKWDWEEETTKLLFEAEDCVSNNGSKSTPALSADILGDWREELILRTRDNKELRIFTTTIPTTFRIYTLMHDPVYRLSIAWQNVAYNQPPHPGFFLGSSMKPAPRPNIVTNW